MQDDSKQTYALYEQLILESEAMIKYALDARIKIPLHLVELFEEVIENNGKKPDLKQAVHIHEQLAQIIAPAYPETILALDKKRSKKSLWQFLGPIPLVRGLMATAITSLIGLITISTSAHVDGHVDWESEVGVKLLLEELFLITSASLGASFHALFQVNQYIVKGTFNSNYYTSYWVRIVLGVVAGMMLAMLIPIDPQSSVAKELTKPLLALLGGFSVTVVYRILNRLVSTVDSLIRGDPKDIHRVEMEKLQAQNAHNRSSDRIKIIANISKLKEDIASDVAHEKLHESANQLIEEIMEENGEGFSIRKGKHFK